MRLSERIYRILLKGYPRRYRERYEEPMAQLFADQLRAADSARRLVRLWLRTSADIVRTLPAQYFKRHRGVFSSYNRSARRSIFFARYESLLFGHAEITPEDMLLGVLRESRAALPPRLIGPIRSALEEGGAPHRNRARTFDLPLSGACQRIVSLARQEADRAGSKQVVLRHLLAGILSEPQTQAAQVLQQHGVTLEQLRGGHQDR